MKKDCHVSVYVHVPFCLSKCRYCDFLSFAPAAGNDSVARYMEHLFLEIRQCGAALRQEGVLVSTLYIGGGTPTVLDNDLLARLLTTMRDSLPLDSCEWTVEANPGTIEKEKARLLAGSGVNRISLGVQDTCDGRLRHMGRSYTAREAMAAFDLCRGFFSSVSLDLMYGLPGQSVDDYLYTLDTVLRWQPDHISTYGLKIEPGTAYHEDLNKGLLNLPGEEPEAEMMLQGKDLLESRGFIHYEISNYSQPGHFCRHNLAYWKNRPYIGLGLGAHSFWHNTRTANIGIINEYCNLVAGGLSPIVLSRHVSANEALEDEIMLGLRLMEGINLDALSRNSGRDVRLLFREPFARLEKAGLVKFAGDTVKLTRRGLPLANLVFSEIIGVLA